MWDAAKTEGQPELNTAADTVDGLADSITENRAALTAMKSYDNYTFTHMVNVSILTMAKARSLGIDGKLLGELGLAVLMHDIGKVRAPLDILNKASQLDDDEFSIMKPHVIDGPEILWQTLNLGTKLCSVADVYDAMHSQHAYQ